MNKIFILFISISLFLYGYAQDLNESNSITLTEAIEIGLKNNPVIKSAYENISAVEGKFWSGISLPSPEIGVSYEFVPLGSGLNNYEERTFGISQAFEFPTNYFLRGSISGDENDIAYLNFKQSEIQITRQIKTAYYNVLAKQKLLAIAKENLQIADDFSKKAEIRYNVGEGTNLERLTAKVQFTEAKNILALAQNELKSSFAELNYSLGYSRLSDEKFILIDSLAFSKFDTLSFENLYHLSLSSNQQIKISELNVNALSTERTLAWSSLLPGFNISYFRQSLGSDNNYYGASLDISVPLWFLFDNRGQIQYASAKVNIAESELVSVKNEVYLNLTNAYNDYSNNLQQVSLYQEHILPQAEEVYRSASASYDAGEITYIEYLQARQTIISSEKNYTEALLNYYRSIFSLEEIVGQKLLN
ncbi:MAG: TolC family protein [Ignavibacteriota bacterium]|nr:TolC family protein [Ignavibacteriales bacterium]MBL1121848.1 TolC family protein [Ignavibacteriota bacterium]MCE7858089.1 TolC family protein [Ignavibacteria bacterium CHB3]MCZ7613818.1 TolC family protein [Ignavibacteriaceae bacterium]MEB2297883.1 TolC family protein [Ignavibacteria bacterium]